MVRVFGVRLSIPIVFVVLFAATPCYSQTGVCCFDDASCQVMTEEDCTAAGGIHWVEGETCDPDHICYTWLSACCYPPYWHCYLLTEEQCSEHEGSYWFEGETCEPAP